MMKKLLIMLVVISPMVALSGEPVTTWSGNTEVATTSTAEPAALAATELTAKNGLSYRERRKLGLTRWNILRTTGKLVRAGVITADTSPEEAKDLVLDEIAAENPEAWCNPQIDWERLQSFLEWLIELLIKYLPYFLA